MTMKASGIGGDQPAWASAPTSKPAPAKPAVAIPSTWRRRWSAALLIMAAFRLPTSSGTGPSRSCANGAPGAKNESERWGSVTGDLGSTYFGYGLLIHRLLSSVLVGDQQIRILPTRQRSKHVLVVAASLLFYGLRQTSILWQPACGEACCRCAVHVAQP